jgi:predicted ABC-type ATPase
MQMNDDKNPLLIVIAGPNGSGKSTITEELQQKSDFPAIYINVDEMMKNEGLSDLEAWDEADRRRADALKKRESFAFETVLSNTDKVDFMKEAKKSGYYVILYFICVQDPEINVQRVQERYKRGEHNIPEDTIRNLYPKSIQTLSQALPISDEALVFNNSLEKPELIAQKTSDGKVHVYPLHDKDVRSKWTESAINELINIDKAGDSHFST